MGLSSVFTYPAFRGSGWGKHVVGEATQYLHQRNDGDLAIVFCQPQLVPFYIQHGWLWAENAITLVGDPNAPQAYGSQRMVQFLSSHGRASHTKLMHTPLYVGMQAW